MINALIEAENLSVESGKPVAIEVPCDSGENQAIYRCAQCQVALWSIYARLGPRLQMLRAATLDEPGEFPPGAHIFTRSKLPWVQLGDIPAFETFYDRGKLWGPEARARRAAALGET